MLVPLSVSVRGDPSLGRAVGVLSAWALESAHASARRWRQERRLDYGAICIDIGKGKGEVYCHVI